MTDDFKAMKVTPENAVMIKGRTILKDGHLFPVESENVDEYIGTVVDIFEPVFKYVAKDISAHIPNATVEELQIAVSLIEKCKYIQEDTPLGRVEYPMQPWDNFDVILCTVLVGLKKNLVCTDMYYQKDVLDRASKLYFKYEGGTERRLSSCCLAIHEYDCITNCEWRIRESEFHMDFTRTHFGVMRSIHTDNIARYERLYREAAIRRYERIKQCVTIKGEYDAAAY